MFLAQFHGGQYMITVNIRAAGGGSHLTEEEPLNDMVFRMCFCCLVALVVAANRCIICPGLAAKRSASTSRQAHLCQWKVTWCASVSLSSNVDSMKFQVWADTEKITLASSSGVVFLLAVHLSDLATLGSRENWLPIRCPSGSTSFKSPKMKTCKIPSPDPCGRPGFSLSSLHKSV